MRSLISALCLVSAVALAQQPELAPNSPKPKVQNIDLTGTTIPGERYVPVGDMYSVPPKAIFKSLIKVRMRFDDKLAESVHEM